MADKALGDTLSDTSNMESFETSLLNLSQIVRDKRLQARTKMDPATVGKYEDLYARGQELPPVEVHMVRGKPYLVDGWHRVEAAIRLQMPRISAKVVEGSDFPRATIAASMANMRHGLPMKSRDVTKAMKRAFSAFIKAKLFIKPNGRWMTYQEISHKLGGHRTPSTLFGWARKHHSRFAQAMSREDRSMKQWNGMPGGGSPANCRPTSPHNMVLQAIQSLEAAFSAMNDQLSQGQLIANLDEVLDTMRKQLSPEILRASKMEF